MILDSIDIEILRLLSENGRTSWAELGNHLNLSGPAVGERVKRLETKGIIRGYAVLIEPKAVQRGTLAFIRIRLDHPEKQNDFLTRIDQLSSVLECHHVTGDDDYWAKARVTDTESLDSLINDIKRIPGVIRTRTTIALATKKEKTLIPSGGGHV